MIRRYVKVQSSEQYDRGHPIGLVVFADVWNGIKPYQRGAAVLRPGDYFYGFTPEITPYRSQFAKKEWFEALYKAYEGEHK